MVTLWDEPLNEIIDSYNITVRAGKVTNIGDAMLVGWFAEMSGTVFNDLNENGRQDPGEPGIPGFPVVIKTRNNSIEDQGSQISLTDMAGHYNLEAGLPAQPVQRPRGLRRRLEDHRRHLPGRQPAGAHDRDRHRRRRQLPPHHRPLRPSRLGRQAVCRG